MAGFEEDSTAIVWMCPSCGDNGYIRGWQGAQAKTHRSREKRKRR